VDSKTMSLEYMATLKQLGQDEATKIVIPMEFTTLLRPLQEYARQAGQD
jgi:hypothetical protein